MFYAILSTVDFIVFGDHLSTLLGIRFLIVVPIFIFGFFLTLLKSYRKFYRILNNFFVLATGVACIPMMIITDPPLSYSFYVGVIMCLIFGYTCLLRTISVNESLSKCLILLMLL